MSHKIDLLDLGSAIIRSAKSTKSNNIPDPNPMPIKDGLRACVNDVPKIKIGKNQNQNWTLIGRGLKPPDYASLFFGNRCQTKEVPRDL